MDLREFCFRYDKTIIEVSKDTGVGKDALSKISRRIHSASLESAIKLMNYSRGVIKIEDLLKKTKK